MTNYLRDENKNILEATCPIFIIFYRLLTIVQKNKTKRERERCMITQNIHR